MLGSMSGELRASLLEEEEEEEEEGEENCSQRLKTLKTLLKNPKRIQ